MPIFQFKLKPLGHILPWGSTHEQSIHWFGLSDGEYWMELNGASLYEYSENFRKRIDLNASRYVDYYISRFVEDLFELLPHLQEQIPQELYEKVNTQSSLWAYKKELQSCFSEEEDADNEKAEAAFERHQLLTSWIDERTLSSGHLVAGPKLCFFRCGDKISLVWECPPEKDGNIDRWTSTGGEMEMEYDDLVKEIADLSRRFFAAMENQMAQACAKDWGEIRIDKRNLQNEHSQRAEAYRHQIEEFKKGSHAACTNWTEIIQQYTQTKNTSGHENQLF